MPNFRLSAEETQALAIRLMDYGDEELGHDLPDCHSRGLTATVLASALMWLLEFDFPSATRLVDGYVTLADEYEKIVADEKAAVTQEAVDYLRSHGKLS